MAGREGTTFPCSGVEAASPAVRSMISFSVFCFMMIVVFALLIGSRGGEGVEERSVSDDVGEALAEASADKRAFFRGGMVDDMVGDAAGHLVCDDGTFGLSLRVCARGRRS